MKAQGNSQIRPPEGFLNLFKQSIFSLLFNFTGVFAGSFVALNLGIFSIAPWTLLAYPGILSMRGAIGGLFCGRLTTGLHLGTVKPVIFGNTRQFHLLWQAIILMTLESSLMMGTISSIFGILILGCTSLDVLSIFCVIMATMAISLLFVTPITMFTALLTFRSGRDPDIIVYPVLSTVSDLTETICYIFVLNMLFFLGNLGSFFIVSVDLALLFISLIILSKDAKEVDFQKTIKESFLMMASVAFIVNLTGLTLGKIAEAIGTRKEIYMVYPALIDTVGDVGSIVGSTVTTKLALGLIRPNLVSIRHHLVELIAAWTSTLIMFTLYSIAASLAQATPSLQGFIHLTALLYATHLQAATLMAFIAFIVGIYTYRRGWDPDNFVIPIESSLADAITSLSLFLAINLLG